MNKEVKSSNDQVKAFEIARKGLQTNIGKRGAHPDHFKNVVSSIGDPNRSSIA